MFTEPGQAATFLLPSPPPSPALPSCLRGESVFLIYCQAFAMDSSLFLGKPGQHLAMPLGEGQGPNFPSCLCLERGGVGGGGGGGVLSWLSTLSPKAFPRIAQRVLSWLCGSVCQPCSCSLSTQTAAPGCPHIQRPLHGPPTSLSPDTLSSSTIISCKASFCLNLQACFLFFLNIRDSTTV